MVRHFSAFLNILLQISEDNYSNKLCLLDYFTYFASHSHPGNDDE